MINIFSLTKYNDLDTKYKNYHDLKNVSLEETIMELILLISLKSNELEDIGYLLKNTVDKKVMLNVFYDSFKQQYNNFLKCRHMKTFIDNKNFNLIHYVNKIKGVFNGVNRQSEGMTYQTQQNFLLYFLSDGNLFEHLKTLLDNEKDENIKKSFSSNMYVFLDYDFYIYEKSYTYKNKEDLLKLKKYCKDYIEENGFDYNTKQIKMTKDEEMDFLKKHI